jgi:flagellar biosynthesis/type III secretory pathway protein FliH
LRREEERKGGRKEGKEGGREEGRERGTKKGRKEGRKEEMEGSRVKGIPIRTPSYNICSLKHRQQSIFCARQHILQQILLNENPCYKGCHRQNIRKTTLQNHAICKYSINILHTE